MSAISTDYRRAALRHGIVVRSRANSSSDALVFAATLEMANYGYRVNPDDLRGMSDSALTDMVNDARAVKGADRDMIPIYPGFPKQVQELDTLTLLVEQILHYWTAGAFLPNHPTVVREGLPLHDIASNTSPVRVLEAGTASRQLVVSLTSRGVALSTSERDLLVGSVKVSKPDSEGVREALRSARNGENIQVLLDALLAEKVFGPSELVSQFAPSMRNVDQLLRLVLSVMGEPVSEKHLDAAVRALTALSDKDSYAVRFATLSRPARRSLVDALGALTKGFHADRLVLRNRLWRRVMRSVHPYAQITLNEDARRAVDIIHGNVEHRTLDSLVEEAIRDEDADTAIALLSQNRPSELLARCAELLRLSRSASSAEKLASAVTATASRAAVTTVVRAYNGVIGANFDGVRVVREAGRNNRLLSVERSEIQQERIDTVAAALRDALLGHLAKAVVPTAPVGISSDMAVPLVRRDLSVTDRVVDRGTRLTPVGEGDTLRVFSHWINTHTISGYLDVGVALLDGEFSVLATSTWNTWSNNREWSTYSGDKLVYPGDSAVEFFDIDLVKARQSHPSAKWAVMTVQSWSGIPLSKVDMVAGTMLRSDPDKGDSFDARTVTSAFSPTTDAYQALPLVFDLDTGEMIWLDASSGSTQTSMSAAEDEAVGPVVRDELSRPRLTMGELAALWAQAHGAQTVDADVDRGAVLALLD